MWIEFVSRRLGSQEALSVRYWANIFHISRERTCLFTRTESTVRSRLRPAPPPDVTGLFLAPLFASGCLDTLSGRVIPAPAPERRESCHEI